jgi:hypothetical protein
MQKIRVVVISVPNSLRSEPLLSKLKQSNLLEVEIFSAIMFSRSMIEYSPNYSKQKLVYGRELSDGEIGSAISHYKILSKSQDGEQLLVVLEDDARIENIKLFEEVLLNFASLSLNTCAVLTLLPWATNLKSSIENKTSPKIFNLVGEPPLTVGYVATPKAQSSLCKFNRDFAYLPDWPPNNVNFYTTISGVVKHGDENTFSLIDQTGRKKGSKNYGIIKFTFMPYMLNRRHFFNIEEYIGATVLRTFTWRLDKLRLSFAKRFFK